MVDRDVMRRAVDDLYSVEPEEFLPRRTALAAAARTAGDKATAKEIAGLRKPTRSAAILNGLARSDPDRVAALLDLAADLRAAERSVDAGRLRELTGRRRKLIDDVTRAAFRTADDPEPSAAIRDEVVSTLTAALADDNVAEQLRGGTLVKAAQWEGFGFGSGPDLMIVPVPADEPEVAPAAGGIDKKAASTPKARKAASGQPEDTAPTEAQSDGDAQRNAQTKEQSRREARARAEQDRREAIADARSTADEADAALAEARQDEQEQHDRLRMLEDQVADARRRLDDARLAVRRAEVRQRKAAHALSRVDR